ncbi:UDP-2,3-diacylglucosamine diphosphatase [Azomonas macrocytogenes]|uniref:UDP-2,3-diacylglucosamine hydrolase n=1 Tax=Azomonas macrocytogenes TaxID=69962 RepID=A0A839T6M3_AZOMA|nr:UDP-2,3-diacylglucosamine diphosphatase [Azomonas macrocytogenes]MBB3104490.1 UDP-2,3-diacylglucosamine hydrolase [Azomonas macrocytogenes]
MSILFISDLHLEEGRPDITQAFLRFLEKRAIHAEALYILGDFFEVWIGDDGMNEYHHSIARALRRVADSGTQIFLMHGNRDFMLGRRFCREAGCTLLKGHCVIRIQGEPVLLLHGDELCTRDEVYQRKRRQIRNPLSLFFIRRLPLSIRRNMARKIREASRMHTQEAAREIIDVTPEAVTQTMLRHGVRVLIHGHTHRPAIHDLKIDGQPAQRIVLGDWDCRGWALEANERGCRLAPFSLLERATET